MSCGASKLIIAITNYSKAMELLIAHKELSEEENEQLQDNIDGFYEIWIQNFGGVTNKIHMLGIKVGILWRNMDACICTLSKDKSHWIVQSKHSSTKIHKDEAMEVERENFNLTSFFWSKSLRWKTNEAEKFLLD